MEILRLTQKPVMTYDQWVIEHAKRSLRGKIKRMLRKLRRRFVKIWNGTIDSILATVDFVRENKKKVLITTGGLALITGLTALVVIGMYYAGESDAFAMGIRTKYGTYQKGYVRTLDGKEWDVIPPSMRGGLLENELVTITFNTNGTEEISDDTIKNIEGWGICK